MSDYSSSSRSSDNSWSVSYYLPEISDEFTFTASSVSAISGAALLAKGIMFSAAAPASAPLFIAGGAALSLGGVYYGVSSGLRLFYRASTSLVSDALAFSWDTTTHYGQKLLDAGTDFSNRALSTASHWKDRTIAFLSPTLGPIVDKISPAGEQAFHDLNHLGIQVGDEAYKYVGIDSNAYKPRLSIPAYTPQESWQPPKPSLSNLPDGGNTNFFEQQEDILSGQTHQWYGTMGYEYRGILNLTYLSLATLFILSTMKSFIFGHSESDAPTKPAPSRADEDLSNTLSLIRRQRRKKDASLLRLFELSTLPQLQTDEFLEEDWEVDDPYPLVTSDSPIRTYI